MWQSDVIDSKRLFSDLTIVRAVPVAQQFVKIE